MFFVVREVHRTPTDLRRKETFVSYRWILCANHMEPVRGLLGRYLRRKLIEHEISAGVSDSALIKIVHWVPKAWSYLNTFLEKHNSSDVTIGPQLLLDCPMDIRDSQDWFTSTWNYSLVPYILEAVKEGLRVSYDQSILKVTMAYTNPVFDLSLF